MVQATTTMHEYLFCHEFANAVQVPSIYKHKTKTPMCTIVCFINLDKTVTKIYSTINA